MDDQEEGLFDLGTADAMPALEVARQRSRRVSPRPPTKKGRPRRQVGPTVDGYAVAVPDRSTDPGLWAVRDSLLAADPAGTRIGYAIRQAFDQAYDGSRTGRWDYSQLMKTEKTHIGTLVEIWLQREFGFDDGDELDYRIAGSDVDAKWSRNLYEWEIPLEMYTRGDKIAMLLWANEDTARMATGLLRISDATLRPPGGQRDGKRRLSRDGMARVLWTHDVDLAFPNTLLAIDPELALRVAASSSGQQAVNLLFREAQGRLVDRTAVVTAAQQVDAAKRVRDARKALREEGIIILGHYSPHPDLASGLGLPRPTLGRFVSATVVPVQPGDAERSVEVGVDSWRLARRGETPGPAPELPKQGS